MPRRDSETRVICPRCGYDLRGSVATWTDSCPLEGVCTECGLEVAWFEVMRPELVEPKWCVEFTPRRRSFPHACVVTCTRSFWPWGFWRRISIALPVRKRRLLTYLGAHLVPLVLMYVIAQASVALVARIRVEKDVRDSWNTLSRHIAFMRARIAIVSPQDEAVLAQAGVDADTAAEVVDDLRADLQTLLAEALAQQKEIQGLDPVSMSPGRAIVEAVVTPLARTTAGTINDPTGFSFASYPAPIELWHIVIHWGAAFGSQTIAWNELVQLGPTLVVAVAGSVAFFIFPAAMAALPITRLRAKVRWSHIFRVMAYGAFIPAVGASAIIMAIVVACWWGPAQQYAVPLINALAYGWLPLGLILWWYVAIKRYLRMPHGAGIAILLAVMAYLAVFVLVYLWQEWMRGPSFL